MFRSFPAPKAVLICYFVTVGVVSFFFLYLNIQSNWSLLAVRAGCVCVYTRGGLVPAQSPRACCFPVAGWWSGRECCQLGDLSQLDGSLKTEGQAALVLTEPCWHPGGGGSGADLLIYSWRELSDGAVSEPWGAGFPPVWGGGVDVCIWHMVTPHWVRMVISSPPWSASGPASSLWFPLVTHLLLAFLIL